MTDLDSFDLARFVEAQDPVFDTVLAELSHGRKHSHWMWFVFPQMDGLGFSSTSRYYSIKSRAEAQAYLAHPILGARLIQCVEILLGLEALSAVEIFGPTDSMKLRSSMTLFAHVAGSDSSFARVLAMYFSGEPDPLTLQLLQSTTP